MSGCLRKSLAAAAASGVGYVLSATFGDIDRPSFKPTPHVLSDADLDDPLLLRAARLIHRIFPLWKSGSAAMSRGGDETAIDSLARMADSPTFYHIWE